MAVVWSTGAAGMEEGASRGDNRCGWTPLI